VKPVDDQKTPARTPHPDFDGHLEYPLDKMTVAQKLDWAWEMLLFREAGRRARLAKQTGPDERGDRPHRQR